MRIALNGWFGAHHPHTGTGQYLRALLEWLPRAAPQHQYHLVLPAPPAPEAERRGSAAEGAEVPDGWQVHLAPCGASDWDKLRFEQDLFPRACRALRAEVAHVPYWAPPLSSPAPLVVTVHDLIPLRLPEYRGGFKARLYTALVTAASRGAALALADSDATRQDILRHLGLPEARVRTVHLGVEARYTPRREAEDDAVRRKYGLEEGYVLYLGGFDARKNVRALLSAWTWAAGPLGEAYPLVLGGRLPEPDGRLFEDYRAVARELGVADTVRFIGAVDEADKPALYRGALAFTYPSRYEGFGLPVLEAMACGVPVVAGNGGSLPEIVGQAGYVLPAEDTRAFGGALITCVVEPSVADGLRARGLERARMFSWKRTAHETALAYEAVR